MLVICCKPTLAVPTKKSWFPDCQSCVAWLEGLGSKEVRGWALQSFLIFFFGLKHSRKNECKVGKRFTFFSLLLTRSLYFHLKSFRGKILEKLSPEASIIWRVWDVAFWQGVGFNVISRQALYWSSWLLLTGVHSYTTQPSLLLLMLQMFLLLFWYSLAHSQTLLHCHLCT